MSIDMDRLITDNNILDRLQNLELQIAELQGLSIQAGELSEISDDLGDIRAGRFIAGEGNPDDGTLTGTVMMYPGYEITIGENTYHMTIVGFENGTMQFGLSAEDGQALFAGGNAKIGINGIVINKLGYLIQHTATDGTADRIGSQGMWAEPGGTAPCYGFGLSSPGGTELVTNGDAETADLTGWTQDSDVGSDCWGMEAGGGVYEGSYAFACGMPGVWYGYSRLISSAISVSGNTGYKFSFQLFIVTFTSISTFTASVNWYDSSDALIRTDTITKKSATSSFEYNEANLVSPAGASYAIIEFKLVKPSTGPVALLDIDNISFSAVSVSGQLYFDYLGKLKLNGNDLVPDSALVGFNQMRGYLADGTEVVENPWDTLVDANTKSGIIKHWGSGPMPSNGSYVKCNILLAKGTYKFNLAYNKASGLGKIDLYIDNVKQNSTVLDTYASTTIYNQEWILSGVEVLSDGVHEIKLLANGKNNSSTGYGISGAVMSFVRTD